MSKDRCFAKPDQISPSVLLNDFSDGPLAVRRSSDVALVEGELGVRKVFLEFLVKLVGSCLVLGVPGGELAPLGRKRPDDGSTDAAGSAGAVIGYQTRNKRKFSVGRGERGEIGRQL